MAHSFLPLALIKPTTQTGHRLSPVSTLHPILDRCVGIGRLSRRVGAQLLIEICQVTSLSLAPDSNKRHRSTPLHRAAIRPAIGGVVNSAFSIWQHFIVLVS